MPESENDHGIWPDYVERDVTRVAERGDKLAEAGRGGILVDDGASGLRVRAKPVERARYGVGRPLRGAGGALGEQEPTPLESTNGCWREDYSWHSGPAASSPSVPQADSQPSTSSSVACTRVSR